MNPASLDTSASSRLNLARTPTPLEFLPKISREMGVEIYIKRDDLTGMELSGNKIRKLEFIMADALKSGADTVVTCGGAQSNHARATAIAAAKLSLDCRLILRTADPSAPPAPTGNILLNCMAGAQIVWITPEEYRRRKNIFQREEKRLRQQGRTPYSIPEGASNALEAWGYIRAMAELARDISRLPEGHARRTTIVVATGSGGTTAGLILGTRLLDLNARIAAVNVCDDRDYFLEVIGTICDTAITTYGLDIPFERERDIDIVDGYVGRGYALSRPEEMALIIDIARREGLFLDPVYTGKAFYGMIQELKRDPCCFGERIIFIHTGGLFGLFPQAGEMTPLLS
ncbi:MAG: D-cysteine desulfhydrase family protein [Deltaproteobacteria bacterium]|nr:D-cysteine desulfhydrase family protein [Deltaproteobacteria bacterium]